MCFITAPAFIPGPDHLQHSAPWVMAEKKITFDFSGPQKTSGCRLYKERTQGGKKRANMGGTYSPHGEPLL